jgi:2,5-diketo-D-gluconate reductase A
VWEAGQWVQRLAEDIDLFDFQLTADELLTIDGPDTGARGGPQPEDITGQSFGMGDP